MTGTIGAGPIFSHTLDILSDMPKWKRQRSTLTAGFSTKQLNEMIPTIDNAISKSKQTSKPYNCDIKQNSLRHLKNMTESRSMGKCWHRNLQ